MDGAVLGGKLASKASATLNGGVNCAFSIVVLLGSRVLCLFGGRKKDSRPKDDESRNAQGSTVDSCFHTVNSLIQYALEAVTTGNT
jgi:hypothetical protein